MMLPHYMRFDMLSPCLSFVKATCLGALLTIYHICQANYLNNEVSLFLSGI